MCGRFTLAAAPERVARHFGLADVPACAPRYNIAPGQDVLVVRSGPDSSPRRAEALRWGLVPSWAEGPELGLRNINARAETASTRPVFRAAFRERRCIVPADGFYEWADRGGLRQPYWIGPSGDALLGIAALWDRWRSPAGVVFESCALLTTAANGVVGALHDRMPAILAPEDYAAWLEPGAGDAKGLEALLRPFPDAALRCHPVSARVNRTDAEGPACVAPVPEPPRQPSLW